MGFFQWLRSMGSHDDDDHHHESRTAVQQAQMRLAREEQKTAAVGELAAQARKSRRENHYAEALRRAYQGRPRP